MMSYYQEPSPVRRNSMLEVSLGQKWRPRSVSMSVVDVSKFSPQFSGLVTRRPPPTPCSTPCFVSPRMAFNTQFSYDTPLQILSSGSPKVFAKLKRKFALKHLSRRWKIFLILVFLCLAATLFLVRTLGGKSETQLGSEVTCAEDDLNCQNGDTSHDHPSFQRFMRAVTPPTQLIHYHSLSEDLRNPEVDSAYADNLLMKGLGRDTIIDTHGTEFPSDPDLYVQRHSEELADERTGESAYRKQRRQVVNGQYTESVQQSTTQGVYPLMQKVSLQNYVQNTEQYNQQKQPPQVHERYDADTDSRLMVQDFGSNLVETGDLDQYDAQVPYQMDMALNVEDDNSNGVVKKNYEEVNHAVQNTVWEGHENQVREVAGETKEWDRSSQNSVHDNKGQWEKSNQETYQPGNQARWDRSIQDNSAPGNQDNSAPDNQDNPARADKVQWDRLAHDNSGQSNKGQGNPAPVNEARWEPSTQENPANVNQALWERSNQNSASLNQAPWDSSNQENSHPRNKAQWEGQDPDWRPYRKDPQHLEYNHQPRNIRRANEVRPQRLQERLPQEQRLQERLPQEQRLQERLPQEQRLQERLPQEQHTDPMRMEGRLNDRQMYPMEGSEAWRDARMQERFRVPPGVNPERYRRLEL